MIKKFTFIALSFIFIALINSCTKDPAAVIPGNTSTYTLDGSPSSCAAPTVAGIYSIGRPLDASNTVTLTVNVIAKGTYGITTTASNGVYFTGNGTFTTTGPQTIVLTGKGTPIRAGNYPYVPSISNTCNFTVSFLSGAPQAVFTYAGGTGSCTAPNINGVYASGVTLGSGNYVDLAVNVTTPGAYTVSTNPADNISFSGSGAFTNTGQQSIRLIGNGTPAAQGPYDFTPSNNGCKFTINVAPPPPPASFTYNCPLSPNISGTFAAGTALTAASTVKIDVNVTSAGLYSVTTGSNINGVTFSGSGVFTGIGLKTITLTSNNTPSAGGTFSYTPSGAGCAFDVTYTTGPPPPADFLKCTIDGTPMDFNSGLIGFLLGGTFSVDGDMGSSRFSIDLTDNAADIAVGVYNKISLANMNKGCSITFTPNTANLATFWLQGLTNSNPFTVTVQTITTSPNKITGIFSGDLFDAFGANKKIVTNGSFSVGY
jgi:hypothetical protein